MPGLFAKIQSLFYALMRRRRHTHRHYHPTGITALRESVF